MRAIILGAAALALAACAAAGTQSDAPAQAAAATSARDCFDAALVTGYDAEATNIIRMRVSSSAQYDVRVSGGACDGFDWTQNLTLESPLSSWICVGDQPGQGNISFRDVIRGRRIVCRIDSVTRAPQS